MFNKYISVIYLFYVRPLVKWFLFKFTRLHELQRICYGSPSGSARNKGVERSLELSRIGQIQNLVKFLNEIAVADLDENSIRPQIVERAVGTIMSVKKINPRHHPDFPKLFATSVEQIWGYKRLYHIVEEMRTVVYDCDNLDHEKKLYELWNLLMPNVELEGRITKQWQDIGFQGDDPKTDFRGMGILGLENLLYFAREYNGTASHLLLHSLHPTHGYTFAIVGINLTSMAYRLLKNGAAKTHIFNVTKTYPNLEIFHRFYCYLFNEFDKYWVQCKPRSIMDFSFIQESFEANILAALDDNSTVFKINLSVENV